MATDQVVIWPLSPRGGTLIFTLAFQISNNVLDYFQHVFPVRGFVCYKLKFGPWSGQ